MYCCELCDKEYLSPEGLRIVQVRVVSVEEGEVFLGIVTWVVCRSSCADLVKNDKDTVVVLTDDRWEG
jgi:hypothetical protein